MIGLVTCEVDEEVGTKQLSETAGTDRENLKGGHLLPKYSAMWIFIRG